MVVSILRSYPTVNEPLARLREQHSGGGLGEVGEQIRVNAEDEDAKGGNRQGSPEMHRAEQRSLQQSWHGDMKGSRKGKFLEAGGQHHQQ